MKIIVTGSAGFIGSHLVDKLSLLGHEVFFIDDLSSGSMYNLQLECRKKLFKYDICDKYHMLKVFEEVKPDIVYHLAAQINVRKSIIDPTLDAEINTIGTLNILDQCVKHKVKKIIFSSSGGAIYKDTDEKIKTESSIIQPISPYGISKYTAEQYINFYKNNHNLDATILRFSNVYGPRQNSKGEAGVISIFLDNALNNKESIIYGDGNQIRDYIYVSDVVDALILSMDISGNFNVSTGVETTVNYLVEQIKKEFDFKFIFGPKIDGELYHNCLSSKLLQSYNWYPKIDISSGIRETIKYFKENNV